MNSKLPAKSTKDSIIAAAIEVLASNPSASLSEISDAAGVKRVTLHRLIGTRDDLLNEIAIQSLSEMAQACDRAAAGATTAMDALRAIVEALVPVGDRCYFLWNQDEIWDQPKVAKESERHDRELSKLIDEAKAEGSIDAELPNAWIIASIISTVYTALTTSREGDIAVNDAGKLAVRTLFDGIQARERANKNSGSFK